MRDAPESGEDRPINRRNLMLVLGGIGGLLLLSNIDGPSFSFGDDDDSPHAAIVIGGDEDAIDAKAERLEAAIEKHVERRLDTAADRIEAAEARLEIDEDALDDGIEDLKAGKPEKFLKAMEAY